MNEMDAKISTAAKQDQNDHHDHKGQQQLFNCRGNKQRKLPRLKTSTIWRFIWSTRRSRTLVLNSLLITLSLLVHNYECNDDNNDGDPMRTGDNQQQQQQITQQQEELLNSMAAQDQRAPRQLTWADLLGQQQQQQQQQSDQQTNQVDQANSHDLELAANMLNQQLNQHAYAQEAREMATSGLDGNDLLESAQSKSVSTGGDANTEAKNTGGANGSPASAGAQGSAPSAPASSSSSSSGSSPLSDQLSAVSNLIQQAGQLGLTAAQQNVALSEAIINGVTNSLIRNQQNRNKQQQQQQTAATAASQQTNNLSPRPNVVGQAIEGDISYDPNENAINGFINFPNINFPNLNFSNGNKPSISSAVKPLLLAAVKKVPIKLGSVGWKLIQLLAWKKIYKAHHPKSGEIIIEQEIKSPHSHLDKGAGGGGISSVGGGGGKLNKVSEHFANKFKTSKMGQSYVGGGGGGTGSDDWMSMMRSFGGGGGGHPEVFTSGGWPQASSESPTATASMLYQRHLLAPAGHTAGSQPAAAAAAAAAATAAAMQSHWLHQQHMMSAAAAANEEAAESQQSRSNATSAGSSTSAANMLRRKKASFGGANWFATTPAHAYAAAAAAANAAVNLASQQQQHQQRMANMMRAYEFGSGAAAAGDPMQMMAAASGLAPPHGHMYTQNLFDNAAAMAVQHAVKLPMSHAESHHNPLAGAEFLDQSDSLSGSPFGSFSSLGAANSLTADSLSPLSLMQRHDISDQQQQQQQQQHSDSLLNSLSYHQQLHNQNANHRSSAAALDAMQDFDDTPAGKMLSNAINETSSFPVYHMLQQQQQARRRMDK